MVYGGCRDQFSVWSMSAVYVYIYILSIRSSRSSRVLRLEGVVLCLILGQKKFELVACDGGWPWLVSKINVIHYVVLTRIAMVAEVEWFTGGWGL